MTNEQMDTAAEQPTAEEIVDALLGRLRAAESEAEGMTHLIASGALEPSSLLKVVEFHAAFGAPLPQEPAVPPIQRVNLRRLLLAEELEELDAAIEAGDIVAAADALTDLQIVLDGTFLEFGLGAAKAALVREVHASNMSKLGADGKPILRADGKILKGPGYQPPRIAEVLAAVAAEGAAFDADEEEAAE